MHKAIAGWSCNQQNLLQDVAGTGKWGLVVKCLIWVGRLFGAALFFGSFGVLGMGLYIGVPVVDCLVAFVVIQSSSWVMLDFGLLWMKAVATIHHFWFIIRGKGDELDAEWKRHGFGAAQA